MNQPRFFRIRLSSFVIRHSFLLATLALPALAFGDTNSASSADIQFSLKTTQVDGADKPPPPPPLIYTAGGEAAVVLSNSNLSHEATLEFEVIQGTAKVFTVGIEGPAEIAAVTGAQLRAWSLRYPPGDTPEAHKLELYPKDKATNLAVTVRFRPTELKLPAEIRVPTFSPGPNAIGFRSQITVTHPPELDLKLARTDHLSGDRLSEEGVLVLHTDRGSHLALALAAPPDPYFEPVRLSGLQLAGELDAESGSAAFTLTGTATVEGSDTNEPPLTLDLLSGEAALLATPDNAPWYARIVDHKYQLVFDRDGEFPLKIEFRAKILNEKDRRSLDFHVPAGLIVPVTVSNLAEDARIDPAGSLVPRWQDGAWQGFLPGDGRCRLAWTPARPTAEGALFFSSAGVVDATVSPGLLRQQTELNLHVLQGGMTELSLRLEGTGEVLAVSAPSVVGWKEREEGGARFIDLTMNRPIESKETISLTTQTALDDVPVEVMPLRVVPEGAVRHSGVLRLTNRGAVRFEAVERVGMTQLPPEQFPKPASEAARQTQVFRFPAAAHSYQVKIDAIVPEVHVSETLLYQLDAADRRLEADVELDIREAPIREHVVVLPPEYTLNEVAGAQVADYNQSSNRLTIVFKDAVQGRQLLRLRLEQSVDDEEALWPLPALEHPGTASVRGHIGVAGVPGYRLRPDGVGGLVEIPPTHFPKQAAGLQHAWRMRGGVWAAAMTVTKLGRHVDADLYHLLSLHEGQVSGSAVVNFNVVGAPVSEWKLSVPADHGHIAVDGEDMRAWRHEGDELTVELNQPALGMRTLLVTFEHPLAADGVLRPGRIHPLDVTSERGVIQVTSADHVTHEVVRRSDTLLPLDELELPAEFRVLSPSPALAAFEYTARPFDLDIKIDWLPGGKTIDQLVDIMDLRSEVSRDGEAVTVARLFVRTRHRKSLPLTIPEHLELWEVRVGGRRVNARTDKERTLVPLPTGVDPNRPIEIVLRCGSKAKSARSPVLEAPRPEAVTLLAQWQVQSSKDRHLVAGGEFVPTHATRTQSGFEWLRERMPWVSLLTLIAMAALGLWLRGAKARGWRGLAFLLLVGTAAGCAYTGWKALDYRPMVHGVRLVAPLLDADEAVRLPLRQVHVGWAFLSGGGVFWLLAGLALAVFSWIKRPDWRMLGYAGAIGCAGMGLLLQRPGAAVFFLGLAVLLGLWLLWPVFRFLGGRFRRRAAAASAAFLVAWMGAEPPARGAEPGTNAAPERIEQEGRIEGGRLFVEADFTLRGDEKAVLPLLRGPAVLTKFEAKGLQLIKEGAGYLVRFDKEGRVTGQLSYELQLPQLPASFALPLGPAAVHRLRLRTDQTGWAFSSPEAVHTERLDEPGGSAFELVLAPRAALNIEVRPRARDLATEEPRFHVESLNLFVPRPGVVDGLHHVIVRPSRGQLAQIACKVPEGFTVSEVNGPVSLWQFDPEKRLLQIGLEPAQSAQFTLGIVAQRGAEALPFEASVAPLTVEDAAGQYGMIGLAVDPTVRIEKQEAEGLSPVAVKDFNTVMMPKDQGLELRRVYRYHNLGAPLTFTAGEVQPEIDAKWKHRVSIARERTVLASEIEVNVQRAGVFQLTLPLPEDFEVEAISGSALARWTEEGTTTNRHVVLHMAGRTLGAQRIAATLVGPGLGTVTNWSVPRLQLEETRRELSVLALVPETGLRLQATTREHANPVEARSIGASQAGALAFALPRKDWAVALDIEELNPWIEARILQALALREGRTQNRIDLLLDVRNASIKTLRVQLPPLAANEIDSVRAEGKTVGDFVQVGDGGSNLWDVVFRHRVIGQVPLRIEFQRRHETTVTSEDIVPVDLPTVDQTRHYLSINEAGRLDLALPATLPESWRATDWKAVPGALRGKESAQLPTYVFRLGAAPPAIAVGRLRHELADVLKIQIVEAVFTTLIAEHQRLHEMHLALLVNEQQPMRIRFPEGTELFNCQVNGRRVDIVREGDSHLVTVGPNPMPRSYATLRVVYSQPGVKARRREKLLAPVLPVPIEKATWHVLVPDSMRLVDSDGMLKELGDEEMPVPDIQAMVNHYQQLRVRRTETGDRLLKTAQQLIQQGAQQRARRMLSNIATSMDLDAASNEDARVQLRELRTRQALLCLSTRRTKLSLETAEEGDARFEAMTEAAKRNPFMYGYTEYRPEEFDAMLACNTAEETSTLRRLAEHLIVHQLDIMPAPQTVSVSVPRLGRKHSFGRGVQVDVTKPLELDLDFEGRKAVPRWQVLLAGLVLAALAILLFVRRPARK